MCGRTAYGLFNFIVILRKNYKILAFNILDRIYDIKLCTNSHVKYYFEPHQFQSMNSIYDRETDFNIGSIISPSRFKLKLKKTAIFKRESLPKRDVFLVTARHTIEQTPFLKRTPY